MQIFTRCLSLTFLESFDYSKTEFWVVLCGVSSVVAFLWNAAFSVFLKKRVEAAQAEALREVERKNLRLSLRQSGLDRLLERARVAKGGAERLLGITQATSKRIVVDSLSCFRDIAAFIEPVEPDIKFNFLESEDLDRYRVLSEQLAATVIDFNPSGAQHAISKALEDAFLNFENHVKKVIRK